MRKPVAKSGVHIDVNGVNQEKAEELNRLRQSRFGRWRYQQHLPWLATGGCPDISGVDDERAEQAFRQHQARAQALAQQWERK